MLWETTTVNQPRVTYVDHDIVTFDIANNAILYALRFGKPLTIVELQHALYITEALAINFQGQALQQLTGETWRVGPFGFYSYALNEKFLGCGFWANAPLDFLLAGATGEAYAMRAHDEASHTYLGLLASVVNEVIKLPSSTIVDALTSPKSLWSITKAAGGETVQPGELVKDSSFHHLFPWAKLLG